MSIEEKACHVRKAREDGAPLEAALAAVELARSTWYYHKNQKISYEEKYQWLRPILERIIEQHPAYGVPRIKCELQETYDHTVNHKVLRRVVRMWDLPLRRNVREPRREGLKPAIRIAGRQADLVRDQDNIGPFEVTITDFTEIQYGGGTKKAKLMPLIGYHTKVVYGWALGQSRSRQVAIAAWEDAIERFKQLGIGWENMIVHHDRDSVYTSYEWLWRLLIEDNVRISYAMRGAKDNTVMEAFNGNFKREGQSLFTEAGRIEDLREVVGEQINYYNCQRRHSTIGYISPMDYVTSLLQ